jgi:hypothetical protein
MKDRIKVSVARDFSRFPGGRYRAQGETSGEALRDDVLVPALKEAEVVEVYLGDVLGLGASFLEEAFGGLVRRGGFTQAELDRKLVLKGGIDSDHEDIRSYIADADAIKSEEQLYELALREDPFEQPDHVMTQSEEGKTGICSMSGLKCPYCLERQSFFDEPMEGDSDVARYTCESCEREFMLELSWGVTCYNTWRAT